ncbi:hypothetical protein ACSNN7_16385 [Micromonospora sp. URMC 105]|uniref:hypothetical protein n=1 Tax=Micromonospora sp. URMC 105 TaxID=3423413 RepID=UPI003F1D29DE
MATRNASGRASGSTATKNVPGNQTPNTPEINESEIARLKVDQLRDRLRRRGITGTADMRKDELVETLITALREGRKTTRSGTGRTSRSDSARSNSGGSNSGSSTSGRSKSGGSGSGFSNSSSSNSGPSNSGGSASDGKSAAPEGSGSRRSGSDAAESASPEVELAEVERRAAELADVTPLAMEVEEVERRAAELEEAVAESSPPKAARPGGSVPQPRSGGGDAAGHVADRQPVRTPDERTGPALTLDTADRVLTSMVPAEMEPVDEVVTPEGTVLTAGNGAAVDTPPLPGTEARNPASSPAR